MTVSSTAPKVIYTGNGSTTSFSIPFTFTSSSEIKVELVLISTNAVTAQTLTTHYSISGTNVVMVTAPTSLYKLVIQYNQTFSQETNYVANDAFSAETHEAALDTLNKQIKQLKSQIDNNVPKLPTNTLTTSTVTDTTIIADYAFAINSTADGIALVPVTDLVDISGLDAASVAATDTFVFADVSDGNELKKITFTNLQTALNQAGGVYVPYAETSTALMGFVTDEDTMVSDSATKVPTQQSVKAYVDSAASIETIQDIAGGMVTGNTETGIAVTYNDAAGTLNFVVSDLTVAGDSGSTGMTPGDTLTIAGGTNCTSAMSGDTLTVNVDDAFILNTGDVGTGVYDFGGATSFEIPNGTAPTVNVTGQIALDTNGNGTTVTTGVVQVYDGTQVIYLVGATNYPTSDNDVPAYDSGTNKVVWQAQSGGGGGSGIANVVEDLSPQLGGALDVNGQIITSAAAGNVVIKPDTSGVIQIGGNSTGPTPLHFLEDSDNGTNYIAVVAPSSIASNTTLTLPNVTGNILVSANDLSDLSSASTARTNLGLGSIATQASSNVSITGGSVTGITDIVVADGGTGLSATTAYAVLCGGTTSTAALQSVASVGTAAQVLTSNGAAALPTFQDLPAGTTVGKVIALGMILR